MLTLNGIFVLSKSNSERSASCAFTVKRRARGASERKGRRERKKEAKEERESYIFPLDSAAGKREREKEKRRKLLLSLDSGAKERERERENILRSEKGLLKFPRIAKYNN